MHRHHIVPKHAGGSDAKDNMTALIPIHEHAKAHHQLWLKYRRRGDFIAWKALAGRLTSEQARILAARNGQRISTKYKESRKVSGQILKRVATYESRSKGGRVASHSLIKWQQEHRTEFIRQCALNGKVKGPKQEIPHKYGGIIYKSKQSLQNATGLSNTGFYGKLERGEILRLDRKINALERSPQKPSEVDG